MAPNCDCLPQEALTCPPSVPAGLTALTEQLQVVEEITWNPSTLAGLEPVMSCCGTRSGRRMNGLLKRAESELPLCH